MVVSAARLVHAEGRVDNTPNTENLRTILNLIDRDQWTGARALAERSGRDTADLYEWLNLAREDEDQDFSRYEIFLNVHTDWPMTRRIRANAERVMPDHLSPSRLARLYFEAEPVSARGMIAYVRALDALGRAPEADRKLNAWFTDSGLAEPEQDMILDQLPGRVMIDTIKVRINRMITAENFSHARGLAARMGRGYPELVAARIALADRAPDANYKLARVPQSLQKDPGLVFDRIKWRRREFEDAGPMFEVFQILPKKIPAELERVISNEQQILIYRYMNAGRGEDAYKTATAIDYTDRVARAQAEWFAGYVAFRSLNQPGRAFRHFDALYKLALSPNTRARAAYYASLTSARLGYGDIAVAWARTAAVYKANFYGQLAAESLLQGGTYRNEPDPKARLMVPPGTTDHDRVRFQENNLPRLARMMSGAGDTVRAGMFVNRLGDMYAGQPGLMRLTVDLALDLKLTSVAVKISRSAATDGVDFSDYVFPMLDGVGTGDVEPAFVYAVIRQESSFDSDAMSGSGALGLMQLMPATAREVARSEKARHSEGKLTDDPHHNIRLGSAYLGQLVGRFGSYALAAAAYNAGPRRVHEWIEKNGDPRTGKISLVDWIESIPVYETRNYVQRVLEGTLIYRKKIGDTGQGGSSGQDPLHL